MENMDFHGFQRYVFSLLRYEANVIMYYYLIQQKCGHMFFGDTVYKVCADNRGGSLERGCQTTVR